MADKAKAAECKAKGNTEFQAKNYEEAIKHFTEAIAADPSDHVFFSNRSACFASLEKYDKALEDATQCVTLKPDWPKGYTRKGHAEFFLTKYDDAAETYKAGLKLAPEDAGLKEGLQKAMDAKYELPGSGAGFGGGAGGAGGPFGMPKFDAGSLAMAASKNPKIAEYMKDQALMQKVNMLMQLGGQNAQMQQQLLMQLMNQDPRILEIYMAAQGVDISTAAGPDDIPGAAGMSQEPPRPAPKPAPKKEEPPPPPPDNRTDEQKEADEFKTQGNALYKAKKFEEAVEMYNKAIEKEPNDFTYYNNRCAVWIEMGEEHFDKVLETCKDLIERRYEINTANPGGASFEKVAKVFARIASVYEKQRKWDEAIEMYNKSLTEDNSRHTRNALRDLQRNREKIEKEEYINPELAQAAKDRGNEFFKEKQYADAKREYDDAVKRNPTDHLLYSNRAAALTKLMAYPDALKDLDECLRIEPTFVKAYSRKGAAHFWMKEYHKSLEAYGRGLAIEPDNAECIAGRDQVVAKIQETNKSGQVDEEQMRHAMADPEIQNILKDPQINIFLKSMQENPAAAQQAMMKDQKIADAVSKLMAAGILRTG